MTASTVLEVEQLVKEYPARGTEEVVQAVRGVNLEIARGETLALVGETGCGKTTVARCVGGLILPTKGMIRFEGHPAASRESTRQSGGMVQMIFQNPGDSLNPSMRVLEAVSEPIRLLEHLDSSQARERALELTRLVGISDTVARAFPGNLTAGEQQRISIARALAAKPVLIILDEPTANLDLVARRQVLGLLANLQRMTGTAFLIISHDMTAVAQLSHRVAVMYLGLIVEEGPAHEIFGSPRHPYTIALLGSILKPDQTRDRRLVELAGEVPSSIRPPEGCPLHPRCPFAVDACRIPQQLLPARPDSTEHVVACHRAKWVSIVITEKSRQSG